MIQKKLIAQVNELLDASWTGDALDYLNQACAWRQGVLDDLTRRGLSGTPIYSDIKRVIFSPSLGPDDSPQKRLELVRDHCSPGLRFIKGRWELAAELLSQPQRSIASPVRTAVQLNKASSDGASCESQYSAVDHDRYLRIGEGLLKTLTNPELSKRFFRNERRLNPGLTRQAIRQSLNRIRSHHRFPSSKELREKK